MSGLDPFGARLPRNPFPHRGPHRRWGLALASLVALLLLAAGILLVSGLPRTHAAQPAQIIQADGFSTDSAAIVGPLNCGDDCVVLGQSSILRTDRRITFTLRALSLQRSTVYGVWAFVFNNPDACSASPCSSADLDDPDTQPTLFRVVSGLSDQSGTVRFAGGIARNSQGGRTVFGSGLTRPLDAEPHFVLRNHGAPIGGQFQQQLREYLGGCTPDISLCVNETAAIHQ